MDTSIDTADKRLLLQKYKKDIKSAEAAYKRAVDNLVAKTTVTWGGRPSKGSKSLKEPQKGHGGGIWECATRYLFFADWAVPVAVGMADGDMRRKAEEGKGISQGTTKRT
jgi:hypothetical protein